MTNRRFLITAGPTREYIDPVRFIMNSSTGTMGYEIAREARKRGCAVTLISGPVSAAPPEGVKYIAVQSARDMKKAVLKEYKKTDCLIMAAAVSDYRPKTFSRHKIKKGKNLTVRLMSNPDILKSLPPKKKRVLVGFALETEGLLRNAHKKMAEKNLDIIIANRLDDKNSPFGPGKKNFIILEKEKKPRYMRNASKRELARAALDTIKNIVI